MKIPKAQFHIGDEVDVRIEEAGQPPTFRARVCGIRLDAHGELDYSVMEDNGMRSDGYIESWLSPVNHGGQP
jgi:hypothetical protein